MAFISFPFILILYTHSPNKIFNETINSKKGCVVEVQVRQQPGQGCGNGCLLGTDHGAALGGGHFNIKNASTPCRLLTNKLNTNRINTTRSQTVILPVWDPSPCVVCVCWGGLGYWSSQRHRLYTCARDALKIFTPKIKIETANSEKVKLLISALGGGNFFIKKNGSQQSIL